MLIDNKHSKGKMIQNAIVQMIVKQLNNTQSDEHARLIMSRMNFALDDNNLYDSLYFKVSFRMYDGTVAFESINISEYISSMSTIKSETGLVLQLQADAERVVAWALLLGKIYQEAKHKSGERGCVI